MITLKELSQKLLQEKSVALISHVRPDGDTIGSTLALSFALESKGIKTDVYCEDNIPEKFSYIKDVKKYKNCLKNEDYSAFVAVDCADINRLGVFSEAFAKCKNTYNIDHHVSNNFYAKYNYVLDNSSNSENVYFIIKEMGVELSKELSNMLLTGIITDTGNFCHQDVKPTTLVTASYLIEAGANLNEISYNTCSKQTQNRAKLFGLAMSKIRYFLDDKFGVITIRLKDFEESKAKQEETEGLIDFLMGVNTVRIGACVMEISKNKFKISFRSKGPNVNEVAGIFGGGGHTLASGCQISGEYEEVIDKITFAASKYIDD